MSKRLILGACLVGLTACSLLYSYPDVEENSASSTSSTGATTTSMSTSGTGGMGGAGGGLVCHAAAPCGAECGKLEYFAAFKPTSNGSGGGVRLDSIASDGTHMIAGLNFDPAIGTLVNAPPFKSAAALFELEFPVTGDELEPKLLGRGIECHNPNGSMSWSRVSATPGFVYHALNTPAQTGVTATRVRYDTFNATTTCDGTSEVVGTARNGTGITPFLSAWPLSGGAPQGVSPDTKDSMMMSAGTDGTIVDLDARDITVSPETSPAHHVGAVGFGVQGYIDYSPFGGLFAASFTVSPAGWEVDYVKFPQVATLFSFPMSGFHHRPSVALDTDGSLWVASTVGENGDPMGEPRAWVAHLTKNDVGAASFIFPVLSEVTSIAISDDAVVVSGNYEGTLSMGGKTSLPSTGKDAFVVRFDKGDFDAMPTVKWIYPSVEGAHDRTGTDSFEGVSILAEAGCESAVYAGGCDGADDASDCAEKIGGRPLVMRLDWETGTEVWSHVDPGQGIAFIGSVLARKDGLWVGADVIGEFGNKVASPVVNTTTLATGAVARYPL